MAMTNVLFVNDRRSSERSPVMRGNIEVDGKLYRIAAFEKPGKDGVPWLSLVLTTYEDTTERLPWQASPAAAKAAEGDTKTDEDATWLDEIPF